MSISMIFGGHFEYMQIMALRRHSQLANIGFRIKHTKSSLIKVSNPFLHKMPVLVNFSDFFLNISSHSKSVVLLLLIHCYNDCCSRCLLRAVALLDLVCVFVTFPCGILGQVWYLIISPPDLCHLSYFGIDLFFVL